MDGECPRTKEILQNIYDEKLEIPENIHNHINNCPECQEYWTGLSSLGKSLAKEIDKNLELMNPPDFNKICIKKKRQNITLPVMWGIAAVFVLSLGIFINSVLSRQQKNAEFISSDVRSFVTDIFSRPLLYDDKPVYINGNGESDWFKTDLFPEDTSAAVYFEVDMEFF